VSSKSLKRKLNNKVKKFVEEYARSDNATHSAIAAGYSEKTAHVQGSRLLKDARAQEYLQEITRKSKENRMMDINARMDRLLQMFTGEIEDYQIVRGEITAAPAKLRDQIKAAELLAKMRGELTEKRQVDVQGNILIQVIKFTDEDSSTG
jgi:phage terminase small subunit